MTRKKRNKHIWSTYTLIALGVILFIGAIAAFGSSDLDEVCAIDGKILQRNAGSWGCIDLHSGGGANSSITSEDGNTWVNATNSTLEIFVNGTELMTCNNPYGTTAYCNLSDSVLENIYQIFSEQANIGNIVLSNSEVTTDGTLPTIINGPLGVDIYDNGVQYAEFDNNYIAFYKYVDVTGTDIILDSPNYATVRADAGYNYDARLYLQENGATKYNLCYDASANNFLLGRSSTCGTGTVLSIPDSGGITLGEATTFTNGMYASKSNYYFSYQTLEKDDTTPDVTKGTQIAETYCTSSCSITNFDGVTSPTFLIIKCADTYTTIQNTGSAIDIKGDFVCGDTRDTIMLYTTSGSVWREVARTQY